MTKNYLAKSVEQTKSIAEELMRSKLSLLPQNCLLFLLHGDLGAGKTQFVQGLGKALGINKYINSPSYVYQREYDFFIDGIEGRLIHLDAWRVESEEEFTQLKIEKLILPSTLIAVEWPKSELRILAKLRLGAKKRGVNLIVVEIDFGENEKGRVICIKDLV